MEHHAFGINAGRTVCVCPSDACCIIKLISVWAAKWSDSIWSPVMAHWWTEPIYNKLKFIWMKLKCIWWIHFHKPDGAQGQHLRQNVTSNNWIKILFEADNFKWKKNWSVKSDGFWDTERRRSGTSERLFTLLHVTCSCCHASGGFWRLQSVCTQFLIRCLWWKRLRKNSKNPRPGKNKKPLGEPQSGGGPSS